MYNKYTKEVLKASYDGFITPILSYVFSLSFSILELEQSFPSLTLVNFA